MIQTILWSHYSYPHFTDDKSARSLAQSGLATKWMKLAFQTSFVSLKSWAYTFLHSFLAGWRKRVTSNSPMVFRACPPLQALDLGMLPPRKPITWPAGDLLFSMRRKCPPRTCHAYHFVLNLKYQSPRGMTVLPAHSLWAKCCQGHEEAKTLGTLSHVTCPYLVTGCWVY